MQPGGAEGGVSRVVVAVALLACLALAGCEDLDADRPGAPPPGLLGAEPAERAVRVVAVDDLISLRDIDAFIVSPDGGRVAYLLRRANVATDAYDTGWFVADVTGATPPVYLGDAGAPQLATDEEGGQVGAFAAPAAAWSPDGRWLAALVAEDDQVQLWASRADGGRRERLTELASDVRAFRWSPDGRSIVAATDRRTRAEAAAARAAEARIGYRLDDRFFPGQSTTPYYRARAEGGGDVFWTVELATRRVRSATNAEAAILAAPADAGDMRVTPDGRAAARTIPDPEAVPFGGRRLQATLGDGDAVICAHEGCAGALALVGWSADGEEVVFLRRFGVARRRTGLTAWNPRDGAVREILATDALVEDCALAGAEAVCAHETATTPRRLVAVSLRDGAVRMIVDPNPELGAVRFGDVETVDLTNRFGHASFAQILTPPDYVPGRRYPVVVVTYRSRGFLRGGVGDEYPPHLFAAAGFVVVSFDMPDSFLYPLPEANDADRPACADCAAALMRHASAAASLELGLQALEDRGLMDPDRVAITGLSAGASIVWDALIGSRRRFAAAIASYAVGDPISVYVGRRSWREEYLQQIGGLPEEGGRAYLEAVSPALNAEAIAAPVLIHVADSELVMSMQTIATLEAMDKPVDVYVFPGELHVKRSPAHRDAIYRRNLQWLEFWLHGVVPEHPLDPGQVARWRALSARAAENG